MRTIPEAVVGTQTGVLVQAGDTEGWVGLNVSESYFCIRYANIMEEPLIMEIYIYGREVKSVILEVIG